MDQTIKKDEIVCNTLIETNMDQPIKKDESVCNTLIERNMDQTVKNIPNIWQVPNADEYGMIGSRFIHSTHKHLSS